MCGLLIHSTNRIKHFISKRNTQSYHIHLIYSFEFHKCFKQLELRKKAIFLIKSGNDLKKQYSDEDMKLASSLQEC